MDIDKSKEPITNLIDHDYNYEDISVVNDHTKTYEWQKFLNFLLFNEHFEICEANNRHIIWIEDPIGCTGKSF